MEEDVERRDEDGVDGRGVCGWDGWVCGLGAVGASSILGFIRGVRAFAAVLPTFVLGSRIQLAQRYRGFGHFLSVARASTFRVIHRWDMSRLCKNIIVANMKSIIMYGQLCDTVLICLFPLSHFLFVPSVYSTYIQWYLDNS